MSVKLNLLTTKMQNERIYSERNVCITKHNIIDNEMTLTSMINAIGNMTKEIHKVYKEYKKKKQLNARHKTDLNRINMEIQKQIILNKKLISTKKDIVKTKTEYEDELKYHQDMKIKLKSTTDTQFEQIQRILAEQEDKVEFIQQQMKINENSVHQKTTLLLKKIRIEKEYEYYKSLCKTTLVNGILSNNAKFALATKLRDQGKVLRTQFRDSVKNLKMFLHEVDLCKSDVLLQFDDSYNKVDKTEILMLITSIFNSIITVGFMHCWMSEAELIKRKAELWTVKNDCGKPVNFHSPFNRTVISFPTDGVLSFKDYYVILNGLRAKENTMRNGNCADKGFKRLQFK